MKHQNQSLHGSIHNTNTNNFITIQKHTYIHVKIHILIDTEREGDKEIDLKGND